MPYTFRTTLAVWCLPELLPSRACQRLSSLGIDHDLQCCTIDVAELLQMTQFDLEGQNYPQVSLDTAARYETAIQTDR